MTITRSTDPRGHPRSGTGRRMLGVLSTAVVGVLALGTPAANADVVDPSGSGASATSTIFCDSVSHTLSIRTTAYSGDIQISRRIWVRFVGSDTWNPLLLAGGTADGWEGVSSNTEEGEDLTALAGDAFYVLVEYSFSPFWAIYTPPSTASEYPPVYYHDPYTQSWPLGSYCGV